MVNGVTEPETRSVVNQWGWYNLTANKRKSTGGLYAGVLCPPNHGIAARSRRCGNRVLMYRVSLAVNGEIETYRLSIPAALVVGTSEKQIAGTKRNSLACLYLQRNGYITVHHVVCVMVHLLPCCIGCSYSRQNGKDDSEGTSRRGLFSIL